MEKIIKGKITEVGFYDDKTVEASIDTNAVLPDMELEGNFKPEDVGKKIKITFEW
jgi:hypothetical protein